ncbi:MAG: hypothetical protein NZ823_12135 [Blastocatellia bacterium]|nr:hypothetical protein [Blastocatellia bacterium]
MSLEAAVALLVRGALSAHVVVVLLVMWMPSARLSDHFSVRFHWRLVANKPM